MFMEFQNRGLTKDDLSHYNDLNNWFKSKNELQIDLDRLLKNKQIKFENNRYRAIQDDRKSDVK